MSVCDLKASHSLYDFIWITFECVHFVQSSGVDENNCADMLTGGQNEQQISGQCEFNAEQCAGVGDMAVRNLHLASGCRNTPALLTDSGILKTKRPRSPNSSIREHVSFKREGSPLRENCQPRKFVSLLLKVYIGSRELQQTVFSPGQKEINQSQFCNTGRESQ
jgi:hypothetical protein